MNVTNEHGHCPYCNANLDGGDIIETFVDQGNTLEQAKEIAANYGYGPGRTKWGRQIILCSLDLDREVGKKCPDCGGVWK